MSRVERQVSGGTRRRPCSKDRLSAAASMLAVYVGRWGVSLGMTDVRAVRGVAVDLPCIGLTEETVDAIVMKRKQIEGITEMRKWYQ